MRLTFDQAIVADCVYLLLIQISACFGGTSTILNEVPKKEPITINTGKQRNWYQTVTANIFWFIGLPSQSNFVPWSKNFPISVSAYEFTSIDKLACITIENLKYLEFPSRVGLACANGSTLDLPIRLLAAVVAQIARTV